jgi:hypothetical protein
MPTRAQQAVPLQRHIRQSEKTFGNQYNSGFRAPQRRRLRHPYRGCKKESRPVAGRDSFFCLKKVCLGFGYDNSPGRTNLDAAFTAQTFIFGHYSSFVGLHFKDAHRTNVNALLVARAFVFINFYAPRHRLLPPFGIQ